MASKLLLKFDLVSLLNQSDLSTQKKKALTKFVKKPIVQREFGNRVIDKIKDRTLKGKDKNNNKFVPYSKAYKGSLEFAVFGKTAKVNLRLTGEMQASMSVVKLSKVGPTIGFISPEQDQKATGHVNGSNSLPVRDFWGISQKDQVKVLKSVIKDFNDSEAVDELAGALADLGGIIATGALARGTLVKGEVQIAEVLIAEDFIGG